MSGKSLGGFDSCESRENRKDQGRPQQRRRDAMKTKNVFHIAVFALLVVAVAQWGYAAEHPKEHPTTQPAKGAKSEVSKEELAVAIKDYVKKDAALKGGYFMVYDEKAGKPLALSLLKVHKERLSTIGDGVYFACADFKTPEGKVYDLDIFMKGPDRNHLAVTEVSVHKEAGLERYTWHEEGGIWKKHYMEGSQPKGSSMKHEHPAEHPTRGSATKEEHPK
jgi:hypothetical protein